MRIPAKAIKVFPVIPGEKGKFMLGSASDASLGMISGTLRRSPANELRSAIQ
jgi:hypothetical protein